MAMVSSSLAFRLRITFSSASLSDGYMRFHVCDLLLISYCTCNNCGVYMRFVGERREHKIHVAAEELASPPEPESHPQ